VYKGSCICGNIKIEVKGDLKPLHACHCTNCRKGSGHFGAGTDIPRENLNIIGEENITWYQSSDWARRGFCKICGANLFFDPLNKSTISWTGVSMGAFDGPTNVKIIEHIFVKDKGDYYEISDSLPQNTFYPGHKENVIL
jgi:hypothetical protein